MRNCGLNKRWHFTDVPEETDNNQTPEQHQRKEDSNVQEPDDHQAPEHHQNQNRSEFWNRRNYIIAIVALVFLILDFAFGNSILIRFWNHLPTIKESIAGWFR